MKPEVTGAVLAYVLVTLISHDFIVAGVGAALALTHAWVVRRIMDL